MIYTLSYAIIYAILVLIILWLALHRDWVKLRQEKKRNRMVLKDYEDLLYEADKRVRVKSGMPPPCSLCRGTGLMQKKDCFYCEGSGDQPVDVDEYRGADHE